MCDQINIFHKKTQGSKMLGTKESTELWRHPNVFSIRFPRSIDQFRYFGTNVIFHSDHILRREWNIKCNGHGAISATTFSYVNLTHNA